jgi:cell wall assembly regulator SMI1
MTTYFIKDGNHESGPFTIDQLRLMLLSKETPVWYAALKEWTSAGKVYELKDLFNAKLSSNSMVKNKLSKIWGSNLLKQQIKKIS